jgi:hypothetical protein
MTVTRLKTTRWMGGQFGNTELRRISLPLNLASSNSFKCSDAHRCVTAKWTAFLLQTLFCKVHHLYICWWDAHSKEDWSIIRHTHMKQLPRSGFWIVCLQAIADEFLSRVSRHWLNHFKAKSCNELLLLVRCQCLSRRENAHFFHYICITGQRLSEYLHT